jgi:hypothetical protein
MSQYPPPKKYSLARPQDRRAMSDSLDVPGLYPLVASAGEEQFSRQSITAGYFEPAAVNVRASLFSLSPSRAAT